MIDIVKSDSYQTDTNGPTWDRLVGSSVICSVGLGRYGVNRLNPNSRTWAILLIWSVVSTWIQPENKKGSTPNHELQGRVWVDLAGLC